MIRTSYVFIMSQTRKQELGSWGEERASVFLSNAGYEVIERNYRVRGGEVDIIAWHSQVPFGKTLCFVEVKTRQGDGNSPEEGEAERATHQSKIGRLQRAAKFYCLEHDIDMDRQPIQFEQMSVYVQDLTDPPVIRHYVVPVE